MCMKVCRKFEGFFWYLHIVMEPLSCNQAIEKEKKIQYKF